MSTPHAHSSPQVEDVELREWLDSLDFVLQERGRERAEQVLRGLLQHAAEAGVTLPFTANTPYVNTIPASEQPPYPGNQEIERRIKSFARWNALAMVVRANRLARGIGGHISTYGSAATLSFARAAKIAKAISSIFKGTLPPESTREPSWKAASPWISSKISAAN